MVIEEMSESLRKDDSSFLATPYELRVVIV
jgi:hypothetical protein